MRSRPCETTKGTAGASHLYNSQKKTALQGLGESLGTLKGFSSFMAGTAGVEPAIGTLTVCCLATWLHPKKLEPLV